MESTVRFRAAALAPALAVLTAVSAAPARAQDAAALHQEIDRRTEQALPRVVALRRDFHQHPELGNRELRTAEKVAVRLRELGYEVQTGVAHTGVVALLRGARETPVVALRADMDALPVTEEVELPFKSAARAEWNGREVGVMHACGHDTHMAILLGAAEVLAGLRERLPGSVKLVFQPAEEGAPRGEEGGAELMVKQGVLENPKVDAIFGLHVFPFQVGTLAFRPNGIMAAADGLRISVRGSQTHGALPWRGVDPIVVSSQIVLGLQTILSRQVDVTAAPAIVTIGSIQGGNRGNIIPDEVVMEGTIRSFDRDMQKSIWERVRRTVASIADSAGASAEVEIGPSTPVTFNDPKLTAAMEATLRRVGGERVVANVPLTTTAEDFACYQEKVPGLFFFLGVTPEAQDPAGAAPNHSPRFFADEAALPVGVRAMASLALDYLLQARGQVSN